MTFITGTITSATPGPALYAVIETAALADGWTLDDTVVIGSNTHKVLKSAAAGNTYNLDWFLDINFPTSGTSGGIRFAAFEDFNSSTDLAYRGPFTNSSSIIDGSTYSRYGATGYALETNWANGASHSGMSNALSTSAFTYWISITRDRIVVMLSTQQNTMHYAGFYEASDGHLAHAGADAFPLITTRVTPSSSPTSPTSSSSSPSSSLTRLPKAESLSNWNANSSTWAVLMPFVLGSGTIASDGLMPSQISGETTIHPVPIVAGVTSIGLGGSTPSGFIGTLMGVASAAANTVVTRGDTVTVGSDVWYLTTPVNSGSGALLMKAV